MSNDYHYVPCGTCRGAKTIMGIGGMYGDCKACKGVGEVRESIEKKQDNCEVQPITVKSYVDSNRSGSEELIKEHKKMSSSKNNKGKHKAN